VYIDNVNKTDGGSLKHTWWNNSKMVHDHEIASGPLMIVR